MTTTIKNPDPRIIQMLTLKGAIKLEKLGMARRGHSAKVIACDLLGLSRRCKHDEVIEALERELAKVQP